MVSSVGWHVFYVSKLYAECISDKVNKIKFLKKMNRVASWEDCREMCNTNDECVQFKFKVRLCVDHFVIHTFIKFMYILYYN